MIKKVSKSKKKEFYFWTWRNDDGDVDDDVSTPKIVYVRSAGGNGKGHDEPGKFTLAAI